MFGVDIGSFDAEEAYSRIARTKIFGQTIKQIFGYDYITAIYRSPEDFKKKNERWINWPHDYTIDTSHIVVDDDVYNVFYLLQGLKLQTIKTKWITAEVDRITALIYFIIIISLFIVAILLYPGFFLKFSRFFEGIEFARTLLAVLSVSALVAVIFMLIRRIYGPDGLQIKALIVLKYLSALQAIKTHKEDFRATLNDIERYLDDNHWTLAGYWVNRVQQDYSELYSEEIREP